jgi:hypothetical protein
MDRNLPALSRQLRTGFVPLSVERSQLWSRAERASIADRCRPVGFLALRLVGVLNVKALWQSVAALTERHEALRTRIVALDGVPVELIDDVTKSAPQMVDISRLPGTAHLAQAGRCVIEFLSCVVDTGARPALRICLIKITESDHILVLRVPHILVDSWSMNLLRFELAAFYEALASGKPARLNALPIQFADYVLWKRGNRNLLLKQHLQYWKMRLAGARPLRLLADHPRPAIERLDGKFERFRIPPELTAGLREFNRRENLPLATILLAAFQSLLSWRTGQDDIVVGVVGVRDIPELRDVVGFCANYTPARTNLCGDPSVRVLLERVRETLIGVRNHNYADIDGLAEFLDVKQPFCNAQFHFNASSVPRIFTPACLDFGTGLSATDFGVQFEDCPTDSDLALILFEEQMRITGCVLYRTDLFKQSCVRQFISDYIRFLAIFLAAPGRRLSALKQKLDAVAWY